MKRLSLFDAVAANRVKQHCSISFADGTFPILPTTAPALSTNPNRKKAAVFIPITNYCGQPAVIFTLRSSKVGTHKGQVSFPGGHFEEKETAIEAAIRETNEELGIPPSCLEALSLGQTVPAITGTSVVPVLGYVNKNFDAESKFQLSEAEVERVFFRTIDELLTDRSYETLSRDGVTMDFPVFGKDRKEERIWGLTAFILAAVLDKIYIPLFVSPDDIPRGF